MQQKQYTAVYSFLFLNSDCYVSWEYILSKERFPQVKHVIQPCTRIRVRSSKMCFISIITVVYPEYVLSHVCTRYVHNCYPGDRACNATYVVVMLNVNYISPSPGPVRRTCIPYMLMHTRCRWVCNLQKKCKVYCITTG